MNFAKGDIAIPQSGRPVDSSDGGVTTQSSAGENTVIDVRNNNGNLFLILNGKDGKPHEYKASLFTKRPQYSC